MKHLRMIPALLMLLMLLAPAAALAPPLRNPGNPALSMTTRW